MILSRINLYKLEMESSIVIVRISYEYITILKRYLPKCSGDENATQRELRGIILRLITIQIVASYGIIMILF